MQHYISYENGGQGRLSVEFEAFRGSISELRALAEGALPARAFLEVPDVVLYRATSKEPKYLFSQMGCGPNLKNALNRQNVRYINTTQFVLMLTYKPGPYYWNPLLGDSL